MLGFDIENLFPYFFSYQVYCENDCNGHGTCVSMKTNAENDPYVLYTYNTNWDAEKIFGCVCDEGFEGYDCSLRKLFCVRERKKKCLS